MTVGQISIFELLETKRMCSMCKHFTLNECLKPNCKAMNLWTKKISRWEHNEPTYQRWLKTPREIFIFVHQEERKEINTFIAILSASEYGRAHHVCKEMPPNIIAWLNCNIRNYFVFNEKGEMSGKQHDICPYCKADLKNNEGDVIVFRKDEKYWIDHIYYDKPKHDHGELTDEEYTRYRIEMDKGFRGAK